MRWCVDIQLRSKVVLTVCDLFHSDELVDFVLWSLMLVNKIPQYRYFLDSNALHVVFTIWELFSSHIQYIVPLREFLPKLQCCSLRLPCCFLSKTPFLPELPFCSRIGRFVLVPCLLALFAALESLVIWRTLVFGLLWVHGLLLWSEHK